MNHGQRKLIGDNLGVFEGQFLLDGQRFEEARLRILGPACNLVKNRQITVSDG
jgi:hypothetical protein